MKITSADGEFHPPFLMKSLFQYASATILGVLFFYSSMSYDMMNSLCLGLILIFGIPHGAVDHKIHLTTSSETNLLRYVLKYLIIAGGYILWWIFDPTKALFIFIILSSYHFGQELLEDHDIKGASVFHRVTWGAGILILPLVWSLQEISPYLKVVTGDIITATPIFQNIFTLIVLLAILISVGVMLYKKLLDKDRTLKLAAFAVTIILLHTFLPFIQAFTLYFVFFHSLNAFTHQYAWLRDRNKGYNIKSFLVDLAGFSLLAIIGVVLLLWVLGPKSQASLITYFFILVSLITLPHAITLDQFYKFKYQKETALPN
ncbi:MAG: beta-carotene 15,15'-dioxygenase, Brp/Blh family [Ekhidna sp.]|nr:beta-carotene 15,15'-dioxygenase, Brp/Blh family [Ekhidna sp.]